MTGDAAGGTGRTDGLPPDLRTVLRVSFGVDARRIRHLPVRAFNLHYVVESPDGEHHATVRDLGPAGPRVEAMEAVLALEARLPGPTAALVRSVRRSRAGRHLEESRAGWVSVRAHRGLACGASVPVAHLVAVAVAHGAALDSATAGAPAPAPPAEDPADVRFLPPGPACRWLRNWCRERLPGLVPRDTLGEVGRAIDRAEAGLAATTGEAARLVHGDLDRANLIVTDDGVNVIDHECLHRDHPLYDLGQLLLSTCCEEGYAGALDLERAGRFLAAARTHLGSDDGWRLVREAARYALLKQLALSRGPAALRLPERLSIMRALDGLRPGV